MTISIGVLSLLCTPLVHLAMWIRNFYCGKRVKKSKEPLLGRLLLLFYIIFGISLFFIKEYYNWQWCNLLSWNSPYIPYFIYTGSFICIISAILLSWVHCHLGKNWTPTVNLLEDHKLITSGPYRLARHPMYTVFFIYCFGYLFASNNWLFFILVTLTITYAASRISLEERTMLAEFGKQYFKYKETTGAFFPRTCSWDCGVSMKEAYEIVAS